MFCVRRVFNWGARIHFTRPHSHTRARALARHNRLRAAHRRTETNTHAQHVGTTTSSGPMRRSLTAETHVWKSQVRTQLVGQSGVWRAVVVVRVHAQAHDDFLRSHYEISLRLHWRRPTIATDVSFFLVAFPFSFYSIFSTLASSIRYAMTIFSCFLYLRYASTRVWMGASETAFTCCRRANSLLTYTDANESVWK